MGEAGSDRGLASRPDAEARPFPPSFGPGDRDRALATSGFWLTVAANGGQKAVGYGKRALVETVLFRYKTPIGPQLRARTLPAQKSEARMACAVINRLTQLGTPVSQRIR